MGSNDFYQQIYSLVKKIPQGQVTTYGAIAAALGRPRAARAVGWALAICPLNIPWHRVINKTGRITIINYRASAKDQAELLMSEGIKIKIEKENYFIDMNSTPRA